MMRRKPIYMVVDPAFRRKMKLIAIQRGVSIQELSRKMAEELDDEPRPKKERRKSVGFNPRF